MRERGGLGAGGDPGDSALEVLWFELLDQLGLVRDVQTLKGVAILRAGQSRRQLVDQRLPAGQASRNADAGSEKESQLSRTCLVSQAFGHFVHR